VRATSASTRLEMHIHWDVVYWYVGARYGQAAVKVATNKKRSISSKAKMLVEYPEIVAVSERATAQSQCKSGLAH